MNTRINHLLTSIYGETISHDVAPRLADLLARHRAQLRAPAPRGSGLPVSQRDAVLITYGDQVTEPGQTPLKTLAGFLSRHARDAISSVHILPFYPYSSDDGFSVIDYVQVDPALGTWEDVAGLGHDFDLMFDAVFNHMSARSDWFRSFLADDPVYRNFFVTVEGAPDLSRVVRPRALPLLTEFETAAGPRKVWTTFSADQVDLDFRNPAVLLVTLDVLLFYVARGERFIRLDAIAYLWKDIGTPCIHLPQTHRIIQLMRAALDEVAPEVMLITETNVPHTDNVSYFGDGTNEAQLVYNFALPPLVLHSLATGNARHLTRWAQSLVLPSDRVTFFNFLASHDGIGVNPARGILGDAEIEALVQRVQRHGGFVSYKHNSDGSKSPYELNISYFDALSDPGANEPARTQIDRFICAHAILLSLAGVPGIYFHSLFGSRNDRAGADASGIPRRINRQKSQQAELENELGNSSSRRFQVLTLIKELLRVRRANPAFHPAGRQTVLDIDPRIFAVLRSSPDDREHALCLHNVSSEELNVKLGVAGEAGRHFAERLGYANGRVECVVPPCESIWISTIVPG
jgi:sucrose phosphorylase